MEPLFGILREVWRVRAKNISHTIQLLRKAG